MSVRTRSIRRAFLVSASFPAAAVLGLHSANAQQTVEVTGPTTANAVEAEIAAKIATPSRDLKVTVTAAGEILSPDNDVRLNPAAGQGDGTITFSNAGKIGSLNKAGDAVADFVAVTLSGSPAKSDNTISLTNSGLITGGVSAGTFGSPAGGTATVTNQAGGKVFNGITAVAIGDAKIDVATGSFVSSGGLTAASIGQTKTVTADGNVTSVTKSGTATVIANGTIASPDGKARGDISANSLSGATVVVGGTAGNVSANATGAVTSVGLEKAPVLVAGKSVTTVNNSTTQGVGVVDVSVSGDVTGVFTNARTTNKVAIDGKVGAGGVSAGFVPASDTTAAVTTTLSEDGKFTAAATSESSAVATGPATSVVIGTGAALGEATLSSTVVSNVSARGVASASVSNAGAVVGSITAQTNQNSARTTSSSKNTDDGKGSTTFASANSTTPIGGAATVTVGAGASVGGLVNGATVGGGNVTAVSNAGPAAVSNAGVIRGNVGAFTTGTSFKSSSSNATTVLADSKATRFDNASLTERSAIGGSSSFVNEASGVVDGGVSLSGDAGATLTNAGTIGRPTNAQSSTFINVTSRRTIESLAQNSSTTTVTADGLSNVSSSSSKNVNQTVGGKASLTNAQSGLITGEVRVESLGDATVSNSGTVRGRTEVLSTGTTSTSTSEGANSSVTTVAKAPALNSTVTSSKQTSTGGTVVTGGSVSGTYAGANGTLNFTPAIDGTVTQTANKDSTAVVSGTIFGALNSNAGTGANTTFTSTTITGSTLDTDNSGSRTFSTATKNASDGVAGASVLTVSGLVGDGNASAAAISSTGTSKSSLALSGKVEGSANVIATGVQSSTGSSARDYAQAVTKGVNRTTTLTESNASTFTTVSGSATADLTGKASILGNLTVSGNVDAAATVAAGTAIGSKTVNGNLAVTAGTATNSTFDQFSTYAFDSKTKLSNTSQTTKSASGRAVEAAPASATVGGTVNGFTSVSGPGGATLTLSGVSRDGADVFAQGSRSSNSRTVTKAGVSSAPGGESFSVLADGLTNVSNTESSESTNFGGKAAITVNTAADLQTTGTAATNGSLNATGFSGASVNVGSGSIVKGGVSASSAGFQDNKFSQTETFTFDPTFATVNGQSLKLESTSTNTGVGGSASIVNAGTVEGGVSAFGATGATVENSGKIGTPTAGSFVSVTAGTESSTTTVSSVNRNNPALRQDVTTVTRTAAGGAASFSNGKGGIVFGGASVTGKTGTVTNNGAITGTVFLGQGVNDFTTTTTQKAGSTATEFTQPAARLVQTYTVDQNGVSRGFNVSGATVTVDDGAGGTKILRTSDVNATINLNKGSATLGSISAQTDAKTGERLTNTTVNLNESGFLGADFIGSGTIKASDLQGRPTPLLILPEKVGPLFGVPDGTITTGPAVNVRGIANLNKTGAGTFVITGTPFVAATTPGSKAQWTLDIGALNNKAGELQLALPAFADAKAEFGILGNVNNDAALVLGRRVPASISLVGDSLVNAGPETIDGITVRQQGNFAQSKAGSLVVGLTPSLVRFSPLSVGTGGAAPEPLGPVQAGVSVPFFTTVDRAGLAVGNSALNITGDLSLGGTVQVDVTRDSLFTNGDGYTLITYTGKGDVTATVTPSVSSKFVSFALKHDTAAKTVAIAAARASYATGATDPNAASAATAFDTALTASVNAIRTDANAGAGFQTVSQIGFAQDIANIATALDYRLNAEQAAQVFRELSSAEIYGSLSSLNQNVAFGDTVNILTVRRAQGGELGTSLWVNPVGNFARYGGTSSGASRIRATSYGAAFGLDFAYSEDGVLGVGGAYAEHDLQARGTPEEADARTWTIGAYAHQRFDQFYANALFAYGFTRFNVQRDLTLLARSIESSFRGNQLDASLEVGYDFQLGGAVVTPYAKGALRRFSMNDFTETGGGGIGLDVDGRSKSVFSPTVGVRLGSGFEAGTNVTIRPFARGSFTFQGNVGADRTVRFVGGGSDFTLIGVRPDDFGTIDLGVDTNFGERLNLFLTGGYSFGGSNKVGSVRGGVNFRF